MLSKKWPRNFSFGIKNFLIFFDNWCSNFFISSPQPKAHRWTYSIGRHPSSVVNIFKWHLLWSHETDSCQISHTTSIGQGSKKLCFFFCSNRLRTLVAMTTYSFHWLIMGKVEIGIYCCLTADILTNVLQKCSLSENRCSLLSHSRYFDRSFIEIFLYQAYEFCPNCWGWLVAMATKRLYFRKNMKKKSSPQKP